MIKIDGKQIKQLTFPDGTPLIKFTNLQEINEECVITWRYENMSELFDLYSITKQLQQNGIGVRLLMPYVPNARQDRIQNECEDIFTLKWLCEIINSLNFLKVTIVDAHSIVTPALLNNCCSLTNEIFFNIANRKCNPDIVFYPDNGANKKYSEHIKMPYAFGIKTRNWENGTISRMDIIGDVKDKNILIVDDISSYGGTFFIAAKKLKELGAKNIYLLVTHCENSILDGGLVGSGLINKIYTTNSIYTRHNDLIEVIYEF